MRYHILGAERQTGDDVDVIIEAASQKVAEAQAHRMNLLIERIEPVGGAGRSGPTPADSSTAGPGQLNWSAAAPLIVLLLVCVAIYAGGTTPDPQPKSAQ